MPPLTNFAKMLGQIKRNGGIPKRDPGISQGVSPGVSQGASQGTNPSLIDLASIFGGGPSTPTEPTGPSAPTAPTFDSYDATPDLNSANAAEQDAYGMKPTEVRSNYGTKDLLALLVAALAGERGGDVLSGYMQGKQQSQAQRMAAAAQADQMAQQKKLQEAAAIRAGIPFKQSRVDKANQLLNDQFKIQTDAYNKGQSNLTKLSLGELNNQTNRIKANTDALLKLGPADRAPWAQVNLGVTDPDLLAGLATLTPKETKDIAGANNLDEKTKTIVALRPGQIENLNNRNFYLASSSKLKDKQAITEVARATVLLPAQAALDMANAKAAVMNAKSRLKDVASMVDTRGKIIDQKRFDAASGQAAKAIQDATDLVGVAKDRVDKAAADYQLVNASDKTTPAQKDLARQAYADASMFYQGVIDRKSELDNQYQELLKLGGIPIMDVAEGFGGYGNPNGALLSGKIGGGISAATLRSIADAQDAENKKKPPEAGTQKPKAKPAPPKGKSSRGTKYTVN